MTEKHNQISHEAGQELLQAAIEVRDDRQPLETLQHRLNRLDRAIAAIRRERLEGEK